MKSTIFLFTFAVLLIASSVDAQVITSVVPDTGTQCEQLTITVTGENTNFYQGTSFLRLTQDGFDIDAVSSNVISSTKIEGSFYLNPDQPTGSFDVNVNSGSWGGVTIDDGFWLNPPINNPELISVLPDTVYKGESIEINIFGEHTHFSSTGVYNSVWFTTTGGPDITGSSVAVIDSFQLSATIAVSYQHNQGSYSMHVRNNLDGEIVLEDALTVLENGLNPEIVSVAPNSSYQGEGLTITITGSETNFQQGSSILRFEGSNNNIFPTSFQVLNDTIITSNFEFSNNHDTGYYDVKINNWLTGELVMEDAFYLFSSGEIPSLLSVSPDSAYEGTSVTLLIKAENTHFDKEGNAASVTLIQGYEELYCNDIVVIDSVTLEANYIFSYENYLGYHDLKVETPFDGTMILENCFNLIEAEHNASIVSVNPDSASHEDNLTISVTGKNIIFMQGTSNLSLSQGDVNIFPTNETIVNDTVISGEFNFLNTFPIGKYDVNVDNGYAWPSITLIEGFTLDLFDFIDEAGGPALFTVYPNPTDGLLNIKRNFNNTGVCYIQVYDIQGNLLLQNQIENNLNEKQIDLTSFSKGVYLLKIMKDGQEQTKRFVIQ